MPFVILVPAKERIVAECLCPAGGHAGVVPGKKRVNRPRATINSLPEILLARILAATNVVPSRLPASSTPGHVLLPTPFCDLLLVSKYWNMIVLSHITWKTFREKLMVDEHWYWAIHSDQGRGKHPVLHASYQYNDRPIPYGSYGHEDASYMTLTCQWGLTFAVWQPRIAWFTGQHLQIKMDNHHRVRRILRKAPYRLLKVEACMGPVYYKQYQQVLSTHKHTQDMRDYHRRDLLPPRPVSHAFNAPMRPPTFDHVTEDAHYAFNGEPVRHSQTFDPDSSDAGALRFQHFRRVLQ